MISWLNGDFVERAQIDAADRGFLLGDGAFETIYVRDGRNGFLREHLARLASGLETLRITATDFPAMESVIPELSERNAIKGSAAARLTVTRGAGERGLRFSGGAPTVFVTIAPLAARPDSLRVIVSERRRFAASSTSRFKAIGGYVENMLAHNDALDAGADEALMLNEHGRLACAAAANVFVVMDGAVATPPAEEGAMPGIIRGLLMRGASETGVALTERPVERAELDGAALFLTNSLIGLKPARLTGDESAETPADRDAFRALQSWYQECLEAELARKPG